MLLKTNVKNTFSVSIQPLAVLEGVVSDLPVLVCITILRIIIRLISITKLAQLRLQIRSDHLSPISECPPSAFWAARA